MIKGRTVAVLGLMLFALLFVHRAAANDAQAKWYQVELIVFAFHQGPNANTEIRTGGNLPVWPPRLTVLHQYRPPSVIRDTEVEDGEDNLAMDSFNDYIELIDEVSKPHADNTAQQTSSAHSNGSPANGAEDTTTQFPSASSAAGGNAATDTALRIEPTLLPFDLDTLPRKLSPQMDIRKQPFVALPQREMSLIRLRKRIESALDLRLLGHYAWRQPATAEQESPAVLVQAGEQFGLNFELEGTVSIREKRYLHVTTEMFFSSYKQAILAETLDWPSLMGHTTDTPLSFSVSQNNLSFQTEDLLAEPQLGYIREIIADLRQSRRVKAEDLHYFDHPLFGMLVKLTEYELPDPVMEMKLFDLKQLPTRKKLPTISGSPDSTTPSL